MSPYNAKNAILNASPIVSTQPAIAATLADGTTVTAPASAQDGDYMVQFPGAGAPVLIPKAEFEQFYQAA